MKSLILSVILAAGCAVTGARAGVIEEFRAADWDGLAYADDESGAFHNCIVYAGYENGGTLMMIRSVDDAWTLVVAHDDWQLDPDQTYPLEYRIDTGPAVQRDAAALSEDQLSIAADERLMDQIRRGGELNIVFNGKEYGFELSNSGEALKAAQDCVERHRGTVQAAAPTPGAEAAPRAEAPAPAQPAAPPAEAAQPAAEEGNASTVAERQTFGHWVVTATDDGAGNFVNCTAFGVYGDDEQLILSYSPQGKWEFGLYRASWSLPTDASYFLWYNVDASVEEPGVMKRPVEAPEPTRIFFEVSSLETLIERAATGDQLNLQLRGPGMEPQSLSYSLDQAGAALDAAKACVARHVAGGAQTAQAPEQTETQAAQPEATGPSAMEQFQAMVAEGVAEGERRAAGDSSLPPIGDQKLDSFQVPGWEGGAYADASGQFTHCSILASYQNGTVLGFARTADNSLLLALARSDWSLQPKEWSPIRYTFGAGVPISNEGQAQAVDATVLATSMGRDDMFLDDLKQSQALTVQTRGHDLSFDISDLAPGLEAIDECRQRHLAAAAAPAASAEPESEAAGDSGVLEEFKVEDWNAAAYGNGAGGLSHCAAFATYQNGLTLYLVNLAGGDWRVGMMNPGKWNLPQDKAVPVTYRVDAQPERSVQGVPTAEATLVIDVDRSVMTSEIASGRELVAQVQGERFAFDLGNADKAVPAIEQCVARHGDRLEPSRKAAAEPNVQTAGAPDMSAADASRSMADLLTRAGYAEHQMMTGDDVPDGFQSYDAVWEIGEIRGMARVEPQLQRVAPAQVRDQILAGDRELCKGEFASATLAESAAAGAILFASTCKEPDWTYTLVYSVVPRPEGGSYVISHMGVGDGEAAKAIGRKVYETALL